MISRPQWRRVHKYFHFQEHSSLRIFYIISCNVFTCKTSNILYLPIVNYLIRSYKNIVKTIYLLIFVCDSMIQHTTVRTDHNFITCKQLSQLGHSVTTDHNCHNSPPPRCDNTPQATTFGASHSLIGYNAAKIHICFHKKVMK